MKIAPSHRTSRWKQNDRFRIASLAEARTRKNTTHANVVEVRRSLNRKDLHGLPHGASHVDPDFLAPEEFDKIA